MANSFEYGTFTFQINCGAWYRISGNNAVTDDQARAMEWSHHQIAILGDLLPWVDEGWEPISDPGPSAINLKKGKKVTATNTAKFFAIILAPFTLGLTMLMLLPDDVVIATDYSIRMRRRK